MGPKTRKLTIITFFALCTTSSILFCLWLFQDELKLPSFSSRAFTGKVPQPQRYAELKRELQTKRDSLSARYETARTQSQRDAVLAESRTLLETQLPAMMRCWLGTKWDFNGITEQPGDGKIACGYYVSTVMRDAGFNLHRIKLAQQPSQTILGAFVPRSHMQIDVGISYDAFCEKFKAMDKGIYIVGLDKHVGFLVHTGSEMRFIHSSGASPKCVVDESEKDATTLQRSNYRVVGNITAQKSALENWLTGKRVYPQ